ncbi:MAG: YbjN domain-containing protein [Pseudomonadota bacterium]
MSLADLELDRLVHPVDVVEQLASLNEWAFERSSDHEITISVEGSWSPYHVSFSWMEENEALHLACGFDLKVPTTRLAEVTKLLALVNEQLWLGHFDLWREQSAIIFRATLLLSGGADANSQQCACMLEAAVDTCERYYEAFQYVVWAGKNAQDALSDALFETAGEA